MGERSQSVKTSSYRNIDHGDTTYSMASIANRHCIAYLIAARRLNRKVLITGGTVGWASNFLVSAKIVVSWLWDGAPNQPLH